MSQPEPQTPNLEKEPTPAGQTASPLTAVELSQDASGQTPSSSPTPAESREPSETATQPGAQAPTSTPEVADKPSLKVRARQALGRLFKLRQTPSRAFRLLAGLAFLALLCLLWAAMTRGPVEERILPRTVIGTPTEVLGSFPSLWFDKALMRNLLASLWRVLQGFGLAALIGIPLGILSGAWPKFGAFIAPISIFGRNVPISALVPLSLVWFGIGEQQKIMFIFIACIMFIVFDAARAIASVEERYVQTALTLGASPRQVLFKVLVPLALPDIFGSLRLLFGLAFGYIILAEVIDLSSGVGAIIMVAQRRGQMEHVYLTLVAITLVAYGIDRLLLSAQKWLFPYRETEQ